MEWISAVWAKINKPLHYLFVGIALLFFAPDGLKWPGYIFVAVGLAGSIEWSAAKARQWWDERQRRKRLQQIILTLNADERDVLDPLIKKGERTFYVHPYTGGGRLAENVHRLAICSGLVEKEIVEVSTADTQGKISSFHIRTDAWKLL